MTNWGDFKKFLIFWSIPLSVVLFWILKEIFFLVFISLILGIAIQDWSLILKNKFKIPQYISISLIYLSFIFLLISTIYILAPIIFKELKTILPNLQDYLRDLGLKGLVEYLDQYFKKPSPDFLINLSGSFFNIMGGIFNIILIIVLSFYTATQLNLVPHLLNLFFKEKQTVYRELIKKIQRRFSLWLFAQICLMLTVGLASFLLMYFLKIPYAGLVGLIAALTEIVPIIGPIIAASVALFLSFVYNPNLVLFVLVGFVVIQQLENHLLIPLLNKFLLNINPLFTLISILVGAKLGGVLGILTILPLMILLLEIKKEIIKI